MARIHTKMFGRHKYDYASAVNALESGEIDGMTLGYIITAKRRAVLWSDDKNKPDIVFVEAHTNLFAVSESMTQYGVLFHTQPMTCAKRDFDRAEEPIVVEVWKVEEEDIA